MKNKLIIVFLTFMGFSSASNAESERPSWISKIPKNNETFSYYIGRSSESLSEAEAFTNATINAREQAISQNFGIYTQFRTENYQSIDTIQSTQNTEAISQQIRLEEFEQVDFYVENQKERKNVWILFKYKKSAIELEKNRLNFLKNTGDDSHEFMISGNQEGAKIKGTLEVTSTPPGAPVRIDGESSLGNLKLRTPLRLMGLFDPGKHTIEIDDPKYDLVQKEIILYPGTTAKVDALLNRAYGELSIATDTMGATVFLGTKAIGTTPLEKPIRIMAENYASIELRHPEMETFRLQSAVERGEKRIEQIELKPLPSTLACSTDPKGAYVEIDGIVQKKTTPTGQLSITRGIHHLKFSKEGYKDHTTSIYVKGGENLVLPNIALDIKQTERILPNKYSREVASLNLSEITNPSQKWYISIASFSNFTTVGNKNIAIDAPGGVIGYQIWERLGIDFGYFNVNTNDKRFEDTHNEYTRHRRTEIYRIGVPLKLMNLEWIGNDSISLIPEIMSIKNKYTNNYKNTDSFVEKQDQEPELNFNQIGKGASLYYKSLAIPKQGSTFSMGLGIRTGIHEYTSPDMAKPMKKYSGGIEIVFAF